jgi:prepilin-type N-terminal cleavage/methylation domain-containing protein
VNPAEFEDACSIIYRPQRQRSVLTACSDLSMEPSLGVSRDPHTDDPPLVFASKTDRGTGFTLLELLIVLLIVAFAGVIVLRPEWRSTDAAELKSAALTFASGLRSARSWAVTHNIV